jgi:hypothetical protein
MFINPSSAVMQSRQLPVFLLAAPLIHVIGASGTHIQDLWGFQKEEDVVGTVVRSDSSSV